MLSFDVNRLRPRAAGRAIFGRPAALALAAVFLLTSFVACGPSTPAEKVTAKRQKYKVELVNFMVQEPEMPAPPAMDGETDADDFVDAAAAEAGDGSLSETGEDPEDMAPQGEMADGDAMEPMMVDDGKRDVLLDLLLQSNTYEQLPGVTVDVTQADADSNEKAVFHVWLETAGMARGSQPFTHTLEDVEWEEGDGFHVEIRSSVPESERGEYREYADAG